MVDVILITLLLTLSNVVNKDTRKINFIIEHRTVKLRTVEHRKVEHGTLEHRTLEK